MQIYCRLLSSFLLAIGLIHAAMADEINLTSGDRLQGQITEVNLEYVVIDTAFAKQLVIEHDLIATMHSEQAVALRFNNGNVVEAAIKKSADFPLSYALNNNWVPIEIHLLAKSPEVSPGENAVQASAQLAEQSVPTEPALQAKVKYSGTVDVGLSRASGNDDDEDYLWALMAQARTLKNRYTLEASKTIEKNDGDTTQDKTFGAVQMDHFIDEKWYAFASASFEKDMEELLDLRSTYSLGSGYQFLDEKDLILKAEAGLAYVDEDFEEDEDSNYTGGRWAFEYDHAWLSWLGVFHHHEGFFSVENSEDINIRSTSGFKFPLNNYIHARLQANIDWDRSPAEGTTGTDKEYIFTLGYEF